MKNIIIVVSVLFLTGCRCKQETVKTSLNTYERTIIPNTKSKVLEYKNEKGEIINATVSGKEISEKNLNASDDEGCFSNLVEVHQYNITFSDSSKSLFVTIEKARQNKTVFWIYEIDNNYSTTASYSIQNSDTQNIEEELVNVSIEGFQYNNVFIFDLNSYSTDNEFEKIIYSSNNGIVFLKKKEGGYLKLEE